MSKQAKSAVPQEKSTTKTRQKPGPKPGKVSTKPAAPPQGTSVFPQHAGPLHANPPNPQAHTNHFIPDNVPPHLRSLYQAFGRGEVPRDKFDSYVHLLNTQLATQSNRNMAAAQAAPSIVRGPLASSHPGVANGLPDRGLGQKPRSVVEVVIPMVNGTAAAAGKGKCPLCGEMHRPSTCSRLLKERHVRLALDGLAAWSSSPQELATERKALKDKLREL